MTADYVHAGVFVPVLDASQVNERFSFSPLGNAAVKLMYWDHEAWASELIVSEAPLMRDASNGGPDGVLQADKESKSKKRKADSKDTLKQKKVSVIKSSARLLRLIS